MKHLNAKLRDEQYSLILSIKEVAGLDSDSAAIRHVLRLARVIYDDGLTINAAFKDSFLKLLNDERFRENCILVDALKTIPQLEKELGIKNGTN